MSDTPPCPKTGQFSWNELITNDTAASGDFYAKLFGWKIITFPGSGTGDRPPYLLFTSENSPMGAGGMMQALHPGVPTHWTPYVVVEDADASVATAAELGAKVLVPVMPIPQVGRVAVLMDPQGAVIGLHELPKPGA